MGDDLQKVLLTEDEILARVKEMAAHWDAWAKRCNVLKKPKP